MGHIPEPITEQLALALKHYRHASRNLHYAHHWAVQNHREHLEHGVLNLIHQASRVITDLATLTTLLDACGTQASNSH
jgi:hypothetical protein